VLPACVGSVPPPFSSLSTHFLWQHGAAHLASRGLLPRLRQLGCAPSHELTFDFGRVAITGRPPAVQGVSDTYCPRRTILDKLLVDAAVEAGTELLDRTSVIGVRWAGGRACDLDIRGADGTSKGLDARVVVGADGRHSVIAIETQAKAYGSVPSLTFVYYSYWSGLSDGGPAYYMRPGRLILRWPTNDGLTCIYVGSPRAGFGEFRRDIETNFLRALDCVEGLGEEVTGGRREERFKGAADLSNFYRMAYARAGRWPAMQVTTRTRRRDSGCRMLSRVPRRWLRRWMAFLPVSSPGTLRWTAIKSGGTRQPRRGGV